ncbi:hypothetical protein KUV65_02565 [Maritalea mobilis]|uniref:hypothetical protein n=1 Tax=Maritalea mobilis TaxID=483324 RepID=UPI001C94414B|nr:hypothetical protein [Maritalea mobilis]MBY6200230.1 hypothetical protein [Maritalea mobilis]
MAERVKSKDGRSETREIIGDVEKAPAFQGRDGGVLARKTATKDEMKRDHDGRFGATRVTKSDEDRPGTDNLGERNK